MNSGRACAPRWGGVVEEVRMRNLGKTVSLGVAICAASAMVASAGPEWPEMGDAGDLPMSAQQPLGGGTLSKISGGLNGGALLRGGDFQDLYLINIVSPGMFSATTNPAGGGSTSFDSQLFLFDMTGIGLLTNDDSGVGTGHSTLTGTTSDGTVVLTMPGMYILGISGFDSDPESAAGPIFPMGPREDVLPASGAGGMGTLTGWDVAGATGTYEIFLEGVEFVPSPGATSLLGLAAICGMRRRRS